MWLNRCVVRLYGPWGEGWLPHLLDPGLRAGWRGWWTMGGRLGGLRSTENSLDVRLLGFMFTLLTLENFWRKDRYVYEQGLHDTGSIRTTCPNMTYWQMTKTKPEVFLLSCSESFFTKRLCKARYLYVLYQPN